MTHEGFPWLAETWSALGQRVDRLPHALLLHGRAGLGKTILARRFAQRVLCEGGAAIAPCDACGSCIWFRQGNHPDFRIVEPEALSAVSPEEKGARAEKETPSRQIKIDQIRALQSFLNIGTHRRGLRVILLRPAEAMNTATASALLKSLEEPPPSTLFLLVSSAPDRLLPTIRSRCQQIAIPPASTEQARAWLAAQGVKDPAEALAYASGAPLAVVEAEGERGARNALISRLGAGDSAFDLVESCQGIAPGTVIGWLQRWVFDLALAKFTGAVRYHAHHAKTLQTLADVAPAGPLLKFAQSLADDIAVAEHPLNARLLLEGVLLRYTQLWGKNG